MTDGDKIAAAVMAAGLCSKGNANPDEYVQHYFEILQKMSQQEGAAQQRRCVLVCRARFDLRAWHGVPIPIPCRTSSR